MSPEELALNAFRARVSRSLFPLIFPDRQGGKPSSSDFDIDFLPMTATVICKLAGIFLQAYWFQLRSIRPEERPTDRQIPPRLDDIITQLWGGHQTYTNAFALSILHTASVCAESPIFSQLVSNPKIIVRWTSLINRRKAQYRLYEQELDSEDWHKLFSELLEALSILNRVEYRDRRIYFKLLGESSIPAFPFIYYAQDSEKPLFLRRFKLSQREVDIQFEELQTGTTVDALLEGNEINRERYRAIREILGLHDVPERIVYLFGSGYEHIQRLATAIADAQPGTQRGRVLQRLRDAHGSQFKEIAEKFPIDFVSLLIAEHGPIRIADEVLDDKGILLGEYLDYLERNAWAEAATWLERKEKKLKTRRARIRDYVKLDPTYRDMLEKKLEKDVQVWCLTAAVGLQGEGPPRYVESIDIRIKMLKRWYGELPVSGKANKEIDHFIVNTNRLVERTFKFLILFYRGMDVYFESIKLDRNRTRVNYSKHEKRMLDEVRQRLNLVRQTLEEKEAAALNESSAGFLVTEFRKVIFELNGAESIKVLLGRDRILDINKYDELLEDEDWRKNWRKFFNRTKHDLPPVEEDEMPWFFKRTMDIFNLLRYGSIAHDKPYTLEPIYPMVISFRELRRNRDGMLVYSYELSAIEENELPRDGRRVSILTPREYVTHEEYYCVPHLTRSTMTWWLEPFLVRCGTFDKIMKDPGRMKG
jgi:hypothetical protein